MVEKIETEVKIDEEDPWAFNQIVELLKSKNIEYKTLDHAPVKTSEEAAKIRGVSLASGAKAMLFKDGKNNIFYLAVMAANRKLSWKIMKKILDSKKVEMAA
jgi:Ala-tRNA(Pro) deacylase